MRSHLEFANDLFDDRVIVAAIEAETLRLAEGRIRSFDHDRFERRLYELRVVPVRPVYHDGERNAARVGQKASLDALLAAVGRITARFFLACERRFRHGAVHRKPRPVDAPNFVIREQSARHKGRENSGRSPFLKAAMRGARRADAGCVERIPLRTGAKNEENRFHDCSIRNTLPMSSERVIALDFRDERFELNPEIVGKRPSVFLRCKSHGTKLKQTGT